MNAPPPEPPAGFALLLGQAPHDVAEVLARAAVGRSLPTYDIHTFFREEDAEFFFGRDNSIDELHKSVQARSCVVLVGPSGSGKSSVIRAGLVPKLRRETHEP